MRVDEAEAGRRQRSPQTAALHQLSHRCGRRGGDDNGAVRGVCVTIAGGAEWDSSDD